MSETIKTTGNKARVARFRARHRRIDFVPTPDMLAWVEKVRVHNGGASYTEVINHLLGMSKESTGN